MDRNSPSLLRTPERNSKVKAAVLNKGLVFTFYNINFKMFAVFGFTELLHAIYNADDTVFCLNNKLVRSVIGKGEREMVKFTKAVGSENVRVVACFSASGACIPFFVV
jgi:hypothetical protein